MTRNQMKKMTRGKLVRNWGKEKKDLTRQWSFQNRSSFNKKGNGLTKIEYRMGAKIAVPKKYNTCFRHDSKPCQMTILVCHFWCSFKVVLPPLPI